MSSCRWGVWRPWGLGAHRIPLMSGRGLECVGSAVGKSMWYWGSMGFSSGWFSFPVKQDARSSAKSENVGGWVRGLGKEEAVEKGRGHAAWIPGSIMGSPEGCCLKFTVRSVTMALFAPTTFKGRCWVGKEVDLTRVWWKERWWWRWGCRQGVTTVTDYGI